MARITKTTDLGNGLMQTIENRTRRTVIESFEDGTVRVTFERDQVTRINGKQIGGAASGGVVTLSDAEARAVPSFAIVYNAISQAADAKEQAVSDSAAAEKAAGTYEEG